MTRPSQHKSQQKQQKQQRQQNQQSQQSQERQVAQQRDWHPVKKQKTSPPDAAQEAPKQQIQGCENAPQCTGIICQHMAAAAAARQHRTLLAAVPFLLATCCCHSPQALPANNQQASLSPHAGAQ